MKKPEEIRKEITRLNNIIEDISARIKDCKSPAEAAEIETVCRIYAHIATALEWVLR